MLILSMSATVKSLAKSYRLEKLYVSFSTLEKEELLESISPEHDSKRKSIKQTPANFFFLFMLGLSPKEVSNIF